MVETLFVHGCGLSGRYLPFFLSRQDAASYSCPSVVVLCEQCRFFSSPSCSSYFARKETLSAATMGEAVETGYEDGGSGQDCIESKESSQSRRLHV